MTMTGSTVFVVEIQALQKLIAEKDAEIERWKAQHEEMLLKHAKEQNIALSSLEMALKKLAGQKALLVRAIDALDCHNLDHLQDGLIAELRKAAE